MNERNNMSERSSMLRRIQICDFALTEANLYLDTHPKDTEALRYYNRHLEKRNKLAAEFASKFGPLRAEQNDSEERWKWIENPWPWEYESEV